MRNGSKRFADTIVIDERSGSIVIDGIELPWWVEVDPEIVNLNGVLNTLRLGIMCEGVAISITGDGKRQIFDPVLGNVGDWARDHVLTGLRERLPWLTA